MIEPPPLIHPLVEGQPYNADFRWSLFFNQLYEGDAGTEWTPTFVSLGSTGTPTITGRYYRLGLNLGWFYIQIVPATNTTSTAATTYCDNFPLEFTHDTFCLAVTGSGAVQAIGGVRASDKRIYPPAWTAATTTITLVGFGGIR